MINISDFPWIVLGILVLVMFIMDVFLVAHIISTSYFNEKENKRRDKEEPSHPLAPPFEFHTDGGLEFADSFEDNLEEDEAKEEIEFHMEDNKEIDTLIKDLNLTINASTRNGFNVKDADMLWKFIVDFKKNEPTYCRLGVLVMSENGDGKRILFDFAPFKAYTILSLLTMGMKPTVAFNMDSKSVCRVRIDNVEHQEMERGSSYIFDLDTILTEKEYQHLHGILISSTIDEFYLGKERIVK